MNGTLTALDVSHARAVAELHRTGIQTGFLSSLGPMFLRQLYRALPGCPAGFGYVWVDQAGHVVGFIACAESVGRLYKQALRRRGFFMAIPLLRFMVCPLVIRRMWQTFRYPSSVGTDLPQAEVLSVVVGPQGRGKGVAVSLMEAALKGFADRGIAEVKVAVGADNHIADRYYRKCGFELVVTREHHGLPMNVYKTNTPPCE